MREFKLPSLGADMDRGTLIEWRVKPGDAVKRGQVVAVVDTTKAAIDVECWEEGTVDELLVQPDTEIPVGTPMIYLREADESPEQAARWKAEYKATAPSGPVPAAPAAAVAPPPPGRAPAPETGRRRISPAARRHAQAKGVDLETLTGTGPQGAITVEDVDRAAAQGTKPSAAADRAAEMRRTIAAAMERSKREIPHYYLATDIPLDAAVRWLAAANEKRPITERLLMAVLLIKATALALAKVPELNGFYRDGRFEPAAAVHVGVAISLRQGGLIAPALLDANRKPLEQLMRELGDLVKRTRAFSLKSTEISQPTVTVTNLGEQGVDTLFPVIYPPQVAIIGFGAVSERPWITEGRVEAMPLVRASLAADHRVSDGHRGAVFLNELKARLQAPEEL